MRKFSPSEIKNAKEEKLSVKLSKFISRCYFQIPLGISFFGFYREHSMVKKLKVDLLGRRTHYTYTHCQELAYTSSDSFKIETCVLVRPTF